MMGSCKSVTVPETLCPLKATEKCKNVQFVIAGAGEHTVKRADPKKPCYKV